MEKQRIVAVFKIADEPNGSLAMLCLKESADPNPAERRRFIRALKAVAFRRQLTDTEPKDNHSEARV
jgi:hypothetical protein